MTEPSEEELSSYIPFKGTWSNNEPVSKPKWIVLDED